jgi:hypothetical protein
VKRETRTVRGLTVPVGYGGGTTPKASGAKSNRPARSVAPRDRRFVKAEAVKDGWILMGQRTADRYEVLAVIEDGDFVLLKVMNKRTSDIRTWRRRRSFGVERVK